MAEGVHSNVSVVCELDAACMGVGAASSLGEERRGEACDGACDADMFIFCKDANSIGD